MKGVFKLLQNNTLICGSDPPINFVLNWWT